MPSLLPGVLNTFAGESLIENRNERESQAGVTEVAKPAGGGRAS